MWEAFEWNHFRKRENENSSISKLIDFMLYAIVYKHPILNPCIELGKISFGFFHKTLNKCLVFSPIALNVDIFELPKRLKKIFARRNWEIVFCLGWFIVQEYMVWLLLSSWIWGRSLISRLLYYFLVQVENNELLN